jgi:CRP-like cAMP-binding protein
MGDGLALDGGIQSYVAKEEEYPDGGVIVKEGSSGDWIYVILRGRVKVKRMCSKGLVTVGTLKEGDIFGEMAFFMYPQKTRSASIVADGPVRVGVLDSDLLVREFASVSPRLRSLIRSLMMRLKETTGKAVDLVDDSVRPGRKTTPKQGQAPSAV